MKKLILATLLTFTSSLFANSNIGISIQTPINNGIVQLNIRPDDHRYDDRYRNFDYNRYGYYDDFGYYFGYFDRTGYFYNNIFFLFNDRYTYYDRLHHRSYFDSHRPHYREYIYHKNNDWNRTKNYRNDREPVYGPYYNRNENHQQNNEYKQNNDRDKNHKENKDSYDRNDKFHR